MARRKSHHRKTHHRRRRVGAGSKDVVMKVVGIAAGAAAGTLVIAALRKNFTTLPTFAAPVVALVGGIVLPRFIKSNLGMAAGAGMVAAGSLFALSSTVLPLPGVTGMGYVRPYGRLRSQASVGAPGFSNQPIGGIGTMQDPAVIGRLGEN